MTLRFLPHHQLMIDLTYAMYNNKTRSVQEILNNNEAALKEIELYDSVSTYCERAQSTRRNNAFITINWKPGTTIESGIQLLRNVLNKKWINEVYYTLEQRGENMEELGKGFHSHMLIVNVEKPRSQIHREIFSTVKNSVGNKLHVDVRMIPTDWIEDKIEYMKGNKWDSSKDTKVEMDKLWRKQNLLETIYQKG